MSVSAPTDYEVRTLAVGLHSGQYDKAGAPYIGHLDRVASRLASGAAKRVAYLHDAIEDGHATTQSIRKVFPGFPDEELEAILLLTRPPKMPYPDYIVRLSENALARAVKISDLADNLQPWRQTEETRSLVPRYMAALKFLYEVYKVYGSTPVMSTMDIDALLNIGEPAAPPPPDPKSLITILGQATPPTTSQVIIDARTLRDIAESHGFARVQTDTDHRAQEVAITFIGPTYSSRVTLSYQAILAFSPRDLADVIANMIGRNLKKNSPDTGGTP